jgi:Type II secretion system (T2SS), protein M subtype b
MTAMAKLIHRPQRLLALLLLLALSMPLLSGAILFWSHRLQELSDARAISLDRWQRTAWIASNSANLESSLTAARGELDQFRLLVPGTSEGELQDALQELVKGRLEERGAEIASIQPLPLRRAVELSEVGLRVQFTLENSAIIDLVKALEETTPSLIIDNLDIVVDPGLGDEEPARSTILIELHGYAMAEAA